MNGMNRRLYFLAPDVDEAQQIVNDLLLHHVPEKNMHVIAREGISLQELPQADFRQTSNITVSAMRGLAIGAILGLIAGLIAWALVPAWFSSAGLVAIITLAGACIGTWVASMIGVSESNRDLRAFEAAIRSGQLLLLVDVPQRRLKEIQDLVRRHHPHTMDRGVEPHKPVFP